MVIPILLAVILILLVWELWIAEGAHFGRRFVVWLYDLAAKRYDKIKSFDMDWEAHVLGGPLGDLISQLPGARLLDVGAGTGRTARALAQAGAVGGQDHSPNRHRLMVALEPSKRMLQLGRSMDGGQFDWLQAWAVPLPLATASFDVVISLEMLEFTPHPRQTLGEMLRVLRPGGWLITSNRIGWQAPLILGRTFSKHRFPAVLQQLGFDSVEIRPWQVDYDMALARKPWS